MSSLTGLISGGGGGTPVNSIAQLYIGVQTQYTDESGGVWLKTGNTIASDLVNYPDAYSRNDISGSSYDNKTFNAGASGTITNIARGLEFSSSGHKMYLYDASSDRIWQFSLSTNWDVSTATYDNKNYDATALSSPSSVVISDDGTKMWATGTSSVATYQYSLSTAFEINTASYDSKAIAYNGQDTTPYDIMFNNDGTKLFMVGATFNRIYEYTVSTPYEINTVSYSNKFFEFGTTAIGGRFNSDGSKFYFADNANTRIVEYSVSTPFDVTTFSQVATYDLPIATQPYAIDTKSDDSKFYISGADRSIYQYTLGSDIMGLATDTGTYDYLKLK